MKFICGMQKAVILLISFLVLSNCMFSNKFPDTKGSTVSGIVKDAVSGESLSGVKVQIQGTDLVTFSDRDGNFTFTQIPAGEIKVVFQLVSFQSTEVIIPEAGKSGCDIEVSLVER